MGLQKRAERKEKEKETRRQEILLAATTVFRKNGFVKTTMDLVADESALAVGTLYRYYKSKEELFVALVMNAVILMNDKIKEIAQIEDTPEKKLHTVWNFFYKFYKENPMYYRTLLFLHDPSFAGAFSGQMYEDLKRFSGISFSNFSRITKECIDSSVLPEGQPREVADFIWSTFVGLVNLTETRKNFDMQNSDLKKLHRSALIWILNQQK